MSRAGLNGEEGGRVDLPETLLRMRLGHEDSHYSGHLIAGAKVLEIFGDVATELVVRYDGDTGLLRAYETTEFLVPLYSGDWVEIRGRLLSTGETSRRFECEAYKVGRLRPDIGPSAAEMLPQPVLASRAIGTIVVRKELQRFSHDREGASGGPARPPAT